MLFYVCEYLLLCICNMYVPGVCGDHKWEPDGVPRTGVTYSCVLPCEFWEVNPGPLGEQTTEPSLQPPNRLFLQEAPVAFSGEFRSQGLGIKCIATSSLEQTQSWENVFLDTINLISSTSTSPCFLYVDLFSSSMSPMIPSDWLWCHVAHSHFDILVTFFTWRKLVPIVQHMLTYMVSPWLYQKLLWMGCAS